MCVCFVALSKERRAKKSWLNLKRHDVSCPGCLFSVLAIIFFLTPPPPPLSLFASLFLSISISLSLLISLPLSFSLSLFLYCSLFLSRSLSHYLSISRPPPPPLYFMSYASENLRLIHILGVVVRLTFPSIPFPSLFYLSPYILSISKPCISLPHSLCSSTLLDSRPLNVSLSLFLNFG